MSQKYEPIVLIDLLDKQIRGLVTIGLNIAIISEAFDKKEFVDEKGSLKTHTPDKNRDDLPLLEFNEAQGMVEIHIPEKKRYE